MYVLFWTAVKVSIRAPGSGPSGGSDNPRVSRAQPSSQSRLLRFRTWDFMCRQGREWSHSGHRSNDTAGADASAHNLFPGGIPFYSVLAAGPEVGSSDARLQQSFHVSLIHRFREVISIYGQDICLDFPPKDSQNAR